MSPALPHTNRYRVQSWLIVLGCMFVVLVVGVRVLFLQSLRLDEAQSLSQTSHSVGRVFSIVATDVHVPLYHLTLHAWRLLFGPGVIVGRSLSLLFFLATIPVIFLLARHVFRQSTAIFVTILVTVSPFLNWYGSEIRMYSMFVFVAVLNQYFFCRLISDKEESDYWWGYAISAVCGIFTHYFFVLNIASQVVFFLVSRNSFPKGSWKRFRRIWIALAILLALWGGFVLSRGQIASSEPLLQRPTAFNLFDTFSQFLFGFQDDHVSGLIVSLWPIAVLLAFFILHRDRRFSRYPLYFLIATVLPVIAAFVFSIFVRPLFLTRYLIFTVPSLYILIGWLFSLYIPRLASIFRVLLVAIMILTLVHQTTAADTPVKENFREASLYISDHASAQDVVALSAPFTLYPFQYYYHGVASVVTIPEWNWYAPGAIPPFTEDGFMKEVSDMKGNYREAWLLLSYDQGYQQTIRVYFDSNFERLASQEFSPGLSLYVYRLHK